MLQCIFTRGTILFSGVNNMQFYTFCESSFFLPPKQIKSPTLHSNSNKVGNKPTKMGQLCKEAEGHTFAPVSLLCFEPGMCTAHLHTSSDQVLRAGGKGVMGPEWSSPPRYLWVQVLPLFKLAV